MEKANAKSRNIVIKLITLPYIPLLHCISGCTTWFLIPNMTFLISFCLQQ